MAVDKLVDSAQLDADLTSVANAIRAKGGTSADLAFPAGFVSAVQAIPSGGGGYSIDEISERSISGDIRITASTIGNYAFAGCIGITSVVADGPTGSLGNSAFSGCTGLNSIFLKTNTNFPASTVRVFQDVPGVIVWPTLSSGESRRFEGWKGHILDLTSCSNIVGSCFYNASNMDTLILRRKSAITTLGNINAFAGTPFASGKSGGTLYVPSDLVASYQAATNWSTILGYANNQILPIEGSPYETAYADGTPIT